jgi:GntR family transcriptional regulator
MDRPYQRVAADLRHRIAAGEWAQGDQLPSWRSLAEHYGVGLGGIRLAVDQLRAEGLVEGKPRSRLHVAYPPAVRTLVDPDADWPHKTGDVEPGVCRPDPELRERLQVSSRVRLHWVRSELLDPDGRPTMLLTTWQRGTRTLEYTSVLCEMRPHALTGEEAAILGLAPGAPAFLVERTRLDDAGLPVQTADLVLPADRWRVAWRDAPAGR